jgi:NAD(P)H-hydrate epimerase
MVDAVLAQVAAVLAETGPAHHRAFAETDGADPEWPMWYADVSIGRLRSLLGAELTQSRLIYLLIAAERAHRGGEDWPGFYARFIISDLALNSS